MRLCVCVGPRPQSRRGRLGTHTSIDRPDYSVWMSPNQRTAKGFSSWDFLWVDPGPLAEDQLRTFLLEDQPPTEILITGACAALIHGLPVGYGLYANEVLDPHKGPHWPRPPRALSLPAVQKALFGNAQAGKFLTTEVPCVTPSHKLESGHGYGAVAVDQDSALLCRPCVEMDIGHAVLRFVLDPAETDMSPEVPGLTEIVQDAARECEIALFTALAAL